MGCKDENISITFLTDKQKIGLARNIDMTLDKRLFIHILPDVTSKLGSNFAKNSSNARQKLACDLDTVCPRSS